MVKLIWFKGCTVIKDDSKLAQMEFCVSQTTKNDTLPFLCCTGETQEEERNRRTEELRNREAEVVGLVAGSY